MPRPSRIPQYRRQPSRNLAKVTIEGKDFYLGPWKSKASYLEYDRLIVEWLANGRRLPAEAAPAITFPLGRFFLLGIRDCFRLSKKRSGLRGCLYLAAPKDVYHLASVNCLVC